MKHKKKAELRKTLSYKKVRLVEADIREYTGTDIHIRYKDLTILKAAFCKYSLRRKDMRYKWDRNLEIYLRRAVDGETFTQIGKDFNISVSYVREIYFKARDIIVDFTVGNTEYPILSQGYRDCPKDQIEIYLHIHDDIIKDKWFSYIYNSIVESGFLENDKDKMRAWLEKH